MFHRLFRFASRPRLSVMDFTELDRQIEKFRVLRDDYRAANVAHYGEYFADILTD